MTVAAATIQYREEMIKTFEVRKSLLMSTCTPEFMMSGLTATFLVNGSGDASATTRGVNGNIPGRSNSNTQVTATLKEWHDVPEMTGFNIFASQGNQRAALQFESMGTINRKIEDQIITELNTGTVNTGSAATASEALCARALAILQSANVPWDGNIYAAITPAFHSYLLQIDSFASKDYVDNPQMPKAPTAWGDMPRMTEWLGVKWIVTPRLPGAQTNAEKCFMYHRSAIGFACNTGQIASAIGYDERHDKSWARSTIFSEATLLQNSGVVVINHDGSAMAAA